MSDYSVFRLRKGFVHNELDVALIGPKVDLSYKYSHLGDSASVLQQLVSGQHEASKKLQSAKKPLIIVGSEVLERADGSAILAAAQKLSASTSPEAKEWKVLNVLHKVASQVIVTGAKRKIRALTSKCLFRVLHLKLKNQTNSTIQYNVHKQ